MKDGDKGLVRIDKIRFPYELRCDVCGLLLLMGKVAPTNKDVLAKHNKMLAMHKEHYCKGARNVV